MKINSKHEVGRAGSYFMSCYIFIVQLFEYNGDNATIQRFSITRETPAIFQCCYQKHCFKLFKLYYQWRENA